MTPAIMLLEQLDLPYKVHQYQHDVNCKSFGLEAADKLNVDQQYVFKTLVIDVDGSYLAVAIIPVAKTLSLKNIAKILKAKKAKMADAHKVQKATGYILGGVSPFGQKKLLRTIIDDSAKKLNKVFVSGGKRGLEIEILPADLVKSLQANYADIITIQCQHDRQW